MGQLIFTALLIAAAWIAFKAVSGQGQKRREQVSEAARRATMNRSGRRSDEPVDLGSLKPGDNGVYEPEDRDRS